MKLLWTPPMQAETARYYGRILTAQTLGVKNALQMARLRDAREGAAFEALVMERLSRFGQMADYPNVPALVSLRSAPLGVHVVGVSGLVLTGGKRKGKLVGDFYLVVALDAEVDAVLSSVFKWGVVVGA